MFDALMLTTVNHGVNCLRNSLKYLPEVKNLGKL